MSTTRMEAGSKKRPRESDLPPRERLRDIIGSHKQPDDDALKALVMELKNTSELDMCDNAGYALLHLAVIHQRFRVAELLLLSGANPDVEVVIAIIDHTSDYHASDDDDDGDDIGCVPLHFANDCFVKLLLGEDEGDDRFWRATVDKRNANGETPFDRCVVYYGDAETARFLLERMDETKAPDSAPKPATSARALATKIVESEARFGSEDNTSELRGLLPLLAKRMTLDGVIQDLLAYESKIDPSDQEVKVYAILTGILREKSRTTSK
jgi:hypothetical protein